MTGITYNYYVADGLALRTQVRIAYGTDKKDKEDVVYTNTTDFLLGLGLQKSLVQSRMFNGYAGVTLLAGCMGNKMVNDANFAKTTEFEFGLRPFMGFEHFFAKNFFISVEWGYDVTFAFRKTQDTAESKTIALSKGINIGDLSNFSVRLGFYF